jgi:hypothetical protein
MLAGRLSTALMRLSGLSADQQQAVKTTYRGGLDVVQTAAGALLLANTSKASRPVPGPAMNMHFGSLLVDGAEKLLFRLGAGGRRAE